MVCNKAHAIKQGRKGEGKEGGREGGRKKEERKERKQKLERVYHAHTYVWCVSGLGRRSRNTYFE